MLMSVLRYRGSFEFGASEAMRTLSFNAYARSAVHRYQLVDVAGESPLGYRCMKGNLRESELPGSPRNHAPAWHRGSHRQQLELELRFN